VFRLSSECRLANDGGPRARWTGPSFWRLEVGEDFKGEVHAIERVCICVHLSCKEGRQQVKFSNAISSREYIRKPIFWGAKKYQTSKIHNSAQSRGSPASRLVLLANHRKVHHRHARVRRRAVHGSRWAIHILCAAP
jgi:hypothetical protein